MAQLETWLRQDLKQPIKVQYLGGNLFSQDNQANLIGVEVFDEGVAATLGGSVSASVIRADGGTVAVPSGTVSGNKATVVLPQAAYAVPGQVSIVLKLTQSGVVTTLAALVAIVYKSSTDTVIDPGTILPSVETLIAQINTAVASIPADYSSLWTSLAPAFSDSTAYAAGQYFTYNGHVYRFTANHAAGSFVSTDCTQVDIGGELYALKSAITQDREKIFSFGTARNPNSTTNNFKLIQSSGLCVSDSNYKIVKFTVAEGNAVKISTDGLFQFQTVASVPTSGTSNRIGETYGSGTYILEVPTGATYLIVSVLSSTGVANVYDATDKIAEVSNGLKNTENKFIVKDSVKGYVVPYNGNILNQTNYKEITSDFIAIGPDKEITVQIWATPTSTYKLGCNVCEYNSSKTYLRGKSYEATDQGTYYEVTVKTTNANCAYIRVSGRLFDNGHMMINSTNFGTGYMLSWQDVQYTMDSVSGIKAGADSNKNALESLNLFVRKDAVIGFINTNGTIADETISREMTSDYIAVTPGEKITAQTWSDSSHNLALRCVYFTSEKSVISHTDKTTTGTTYIQNVYTIPDNAAYIRIGSRYLKTDAHMMVNRGAVDMAYLLSWQDIDSKFQALNQGGAYGLNNPLLKPAAPRIAMHRGFMNEAPENTVPAFELAGQAGAWGIETDVWETTDGYFVLSHDDDVSRMTDGTGKISEMTYAETQECTVDAGPNIGEYPDLKMPLLEDYLKICRRYGCVPCIEIKGITNYDKFIETIRKSGMEGSSVLALYWDEATFGTLRELTAMPIMIVATGGFSDAVAQAQRFPDIWLDMIATYVTAENLKLAHDVNVPVAGWTYESQSSIGSAVEIGMDIAISGSVAKLTE